MPVKAIADSGLIIAFLDLPRLHELTRKYAGRGMDLAEGCVVCMAERRPGRVVWTVDRKDFQVYRLRREEPVAWQFSD